MDVAGPPCRQDLDSKADEGIEPFATADNLASLREQLVQQASVQLDEPDMSDDDDDNDVHSIEAPSKRAMPSGRYHSPFPALTHLSGGQRCTDRLAWRCNKVTELIKQPFKDPLWDAAYTLTLSALRSGSLLEHCGSVTFRTARQRERVAVG